MKTIVVSQLKGGVGKSITSSNLSIALSLCLPVDRFDDETNRAKKDTKQMIKSRVLLIDMDGQCNLSWEYGFDKDDCKAMKGIRDILIDGLPASEVVQYVKPRFKRMSKNEKYQYGIITGYPKLLKLLNETHGVEPIPYILDEALNTVAENFDYCVIDTPVAVSLDHIISNAYCAADYILLPAEPEIASLQALEEMQDTLKELKEKHGKDLKPLGIVICNYDTRTNIDNKLSDALKEMADIVGFRLFDTKIRHCTAVKCARENQMSVIEYKANSYAAYNYKGLSYEIIKIMYEDFKKGGK